MRPLADFEKLLDKNPQSYEHLVSLLNHMKILTRQKEHRLSIGKSYMVAMLHILKDDKFPRTIAAECASVILNLCHEKDNVDLVLKNDGLTVLINLLSSSDEELQANAAGALQSICFQPEGRSIVRNCGAIPFLIQLLSAKSINVKARAVGSLHNISTDAEAIHIIRKKGGIKPLLRLLQCSHPNICGSAAGALQNLSREVASRLLIRSSEAVMSLVHLLGSSELQTQICAAGALLNILGPELGEDKSSKKRQAFIQVVKSMLVISTIYNLCFSQQARMKESLSRLNI